jgi:hypothetical protein
MCNAVSKWKFNYLRERRIVYRGVEIKDMCNAGASGNYLRERRMEEWRSKTCAMP